MSSYNWSYIPQLFINSIEIFLNTTTLLDYKETGEYNDIDTDKFSLDIVQQTLKKLGALERKILDRSPL